MTARTTRRLRRSILATAAVVASVAALPPAAFGLVQAYNEPAFTKTNVNNSYWFHYTKVSGVDSNGNTDPTYYLCFSVYKDNILVESHQGVNGPGSANCTGSLGGGSTGDYGVYPNAPGGALVNGSKYEVCATDFRRNVFVWTSGLSSCEWSVIDRSVPGVAAGINGADTVTNNPLLNFQINFSDTVGQPWPANYRCYKVGSPCTDADTFTYDPNCSVPTPANTWAFVCQGDVTANADGTHYFCARVADQAIPDNSAGSNQFVYAGGGGVTSNTANISGTACGSILLDRVAPAVTAGASATTVTVGQLVSFTGSATDGGSGLAGDYTWVWGDNTANGTGATPTHTYTQAGTYEAAASIKDAANNSGTGKILITVNPAPTGGGDTTTPPPSGDTTTPPPSGDTTTPPPSGDTTTPPPSGDTTTSTGGTLGGTTKPTEISKESGGGGTQAEDIGGLDVVAPRRFTLRAKRRRLPLALSPDRAGRVQLALVRNGRIFARAAATLGKPGTFGLRMKLPKRLKPARYKLKVTFRPLGSTRATTKTLKIRFVAAKRRTQGRATSSSSRPKLKGSAPVWRHRTFARGVGTAYSW